MHDIPFLRAPPGELGLCARQASSGGQAPCRVESVERLSVSICQPPCIHKDKIASNLDTAGHSGRHAVMRGTPGCAQLALNSAGRASGGLACWGFAAVAEAAAVLAGPDAGDP